MKSASTIEEGATNQTDELTRQMNELIMIVKNQQVQNTKGEIRTVIIDSMDRKSIKATIKGEET